MQQGSFEADQQITPVRVMGFIDGFNLYHALDKFENAASYAEEIKYQKYKWLCLWTLISQFVLPSEKLVGVEYFTSYPNWKGSEAKVVRHKTYAGALRSRGVSITTGEFKTKETECRACHHIFLAPIEKQTDINIAISLISKAPEYDKAILLTADSDQVPVIRMLKDLYPDKQYVSLAPIGRSSKELTKVCGRRFVMTEEHLIASQLPNPLPIGDVNRGTKTFYVKPSTWV